MNEFNLQDTIALLSRTPPTLDSLLRELPDSWTRLNEGKNTFDAFEVVGHLIHGERTDWIPRAKMILQFGDSRPFEAFDRSGHRQEIEGKPMGELLDEFSRARSENMATLRSMNLTARDLEKRGLHPALGLVTMSQLLATWTAHDLTHLHQISRTMARRYSETVGPWNAYLGVMHCNGHGS
jgi:DinB superfamily